MLDTCFNFETFSLTNTFGELVNDATNYLDFEVKVHVLVYLAKIPTSYHLYLELNILRKWTHRLYNYLYLELNILGKWTHRLYTYYVLTVNKKLSIWEKRLMK